MSAHVQSQLFELVVGLVTGLTTTGTNVFPGVEHPETPDTMPGITVSISDSRFLSGSLDSTVKEFDLELGYYAPGDDVAVTTQISMEVAARLYGPGGISAGVSYGGSSRKYKPDAAYKHTVLSEVYKIHFETADGNDGVVY
jgi:hypothetical protein